MAKLRVLIADDDHIFCKLTQDVICAAGYNVEIAHSVEQARRVLDSVPIDIVMQDMCFPALQDGFAMLEEMQKRSPEMPVLMISGAGHIPDAVNAIKYGATDFIEKPISKEHLVIRLSRLSEKLITLRNMHDLQVSAIGMIGKSPAMQSVYEKIIRAAQYDTPVLISGDTGVGKELAANAIHRLSAQSHKSMISINCASIPRELFEAELFGYEKGAFTGAHTSRKGYFEHAAGSSLFLDEIAELPMEVQAKLLRVISENQLQKLGGSTQKISLRLISASNRNLPQMVADGSFRSDLYYRISTVNIGIPPLSERKEDIIPLANHFMTEFCNQHNIAPKSLTPSAISWLMEQDFPGNVRELRNTIDRAMIFSKKESLSVVDFTIKGHDAPEDGKSFRETVRSFEKQYLETVLAMHSGSLTKTAIYLQMDKSNLNKKLLSLGIFNTRK